MRAGILIAAVVFGLVPSDDLQHNPDPSAESPPAVEPLAAPEFRVAFSGDRIDIAATSSSAGHEEALTDLVAEQFPGLTANIEFRPGLFPGDAWEPASMRLLYLLGSMQSAHATMLDNEIVLRGVTLQADALSSRIDILRGSLAADTTLSTDIVVVSSTASFDDLCERVFASLFLDPVSFHESSARIRQSSLVTLDRITEFARDCPAVRIGVTGHSDASGNESHNRQLSRARAQAVADHIIANGIDPTRLIVSGLGSSRPIADNSTRLGRERNRRIEFELR